VHVVIEARSLLSIQTCIVDAKPDASICTSNKLEGGRGCPGWFGNERVAIPSEQKS
jgi:hypothetical protein